LRRLRCRAVGEEQHKEEITCLNHLLFADASAQWQRRQNARECRANGSIYDHVGHSVPAHVKASNEQRALKQYKKQ
jgi:hypothetical protein